MSVLSVDKVEQDPKYDDSGWTIRETWQVRFSDDHDLTNIGIDAIYAMANDASAPDYGDYHPSTTLARCVDLDPREEDRRVWNVQATFEERAAALDPKDEAPDIRWGSWSERQVVWQDKDGDALRNSAGDWFDPPVVEDKTYDEVTIIRNTDKDAYNPELATAYENTVNSDSITIAGVDLVPGQALLKKWDAKQDQARGYEYWRETLKIAMHPDTWTKYLLDQGLYEINANGDKVPITVQGSEVSEPQMLDGNGSYVGDGAGPSAAVFLAFQIKRQNPFWKLELPTEAYPS